jgi:transcription antitermination factor NusG
MCDSCEQLWLAVSVRSRCEKSVRRILDYKGYATSLPLRKCWHTRRSGSVWESEKPLIAGYVFVAHYAQNPFRMVTTPGVVEIVGFGDEPGLIPAADIEALERLAASLLPVSQWAYTPVGQEVQLIGGPLRGVQGIVVRESGSTRLVVNVRLLQRAVAVEIESEWAVSSQCVCGAVC